MILDGTGLFLYTDQGGNTSTSSTRRIPAHAVPEDAQSKSDSSEHEAQRKLSRQYSSRQLLQITKSELLYLGKLEFMEPFPTSAGEPSGLLQKPTHSAKITQLATCRSQATNLISRVILFQKYIVYLFGCTSFCWAFLLLSAQIGAVHGADRV